MDLDGILNPPHAYVRTYGTPLSLAISTNTHAPHKYETPTESRVPGIAVDTDGMGVLAMLCSVRSAGRVCSPAPRRRRRAVGARGVVRAAPSFWDWDWDSVIYNGWLVGWRWLVVTPLFNQKLSRLKFMWTREIPTSLQMRWEGRGGGANLNATKYKYMCKCIISMHTFKSSCNIRPL